MKALILGGTGAIGKALVPILAKRNFEVYVTTRKDRESKGKIRYIKGNAHDMEFLKKTISNNKFDIIIDFMDYKFLEFKDKIDFFLNNTKQYIFLSSARVYSNLNKTIDENTPRLLDILDDEEYLSTTDYALEKAREENLFFENSKKNWTIVRPYLTYNDNRLQLGVCGKEEWLYRVLKGKKIAIPRKLLERITTLTYAEDVSSCISKLILNEYAYGEIYQIADNLSKTKWKDILNIYQKELNKRNFTINIQVIDDEKYDKYWNYYQLKYDRYYDRIFNSDKLEKVIKEKIVYSDVKNSLAKCISSFLDKVDINSIKLQPQYTGIMDKMTKEHTKLSEFSFKGKIKYILARYTNYYNDYNIESRKTKKVNELSTWGGEF